MRRIKYASLLLLLAPYLSVAAEVGSSSGDGVGLKAIAAALAIGMGALGGALGQGKVASAAMESIGRNPQATKSMFVPFMVALAMIESLVLFCLVIAMIKT